MTQDEPARPENAAHQDERISALVERVDEGYGQALVELLIQRLELSVREFEEEITQLVDRLRHNAAARGELLDRIKHSAAGEPATGEAAPGAPMEDVPEWERRLAELEGPAN